MKKLGVMLALMLCLTIVIPMAIAASRCPLYADGDHRYVNEPDNKLLRYEQIPGNNTVHREYYTIIQHCKCGDTRRNPAFNEWSEERLHQHNAVLAKVDKGACRIDAQYHYKVCDMLKKCACGHEGWDYNQVDRSVKISHSFTRVVSTVNKPNGQRIVTKKCVCGEQKTFTYNNTIAPK